MHILGIESSCDDTSVALIEANDNVFSIISEKTASQIEVHKKYGGVIPEIAGRKHAEHILPVVEEVMEQESKKARKQESKKPDMIAVTAGPGLVTGLLVGVEVARTLSYLWDVPLVGVNHIDGHIHSVELGNKEIGKLGNKNSIEFPALCLVVSGGHTELVLMKDHGDYERIGKTRDDAAGECFDKVAKLVGLEYPGGPKISKLAAEGNTKAIAFPRPMLREDNYDFSFAGLKTAALYWLRDNGMTETGNWKLETRVTLTDFCASFEQAIVDVLVAKTLRAVQQYKPKSIVLGGGVAANKKLRETLSTAIEQQSPISNFLFPISNYSMDNAAMIAVAGYYKFQQGKTISWKNIAVDPNWRIA